MLFSLEPPLPPLPASWKLTQLDVETATAKFDLYLELDDRPEGLIGRFLYSTDLFEPSTIARMVGHFHSLVDAIVADPDRRLSALPLLTPAERQQLLVDWNDTSDARIRTTRPSTRCSRPRSRARRPRSRSSRATKRSPTAS